MEANKQVEKIVNDLQEAKRYFKILSQEKIDEADEVDEDDAEKFQYEADALDEFVTDIDSLLAKMAVEFDNLEIEQE